MYRLHVLEKSNYIYQSSFWCHLVKVSTMKVGSRWGIQSPQSTFLNTSTVWRIPHSDYFPTFINPFHKGNPVETRLLIFPNNEPGNGGQLPQLKAVKQGPVRIPWGINISKSKLFDRSQRIETQNKTTKSQKTYLFMIVAKSDKTSDSLASGTFLE